MAVSLSEDQMKAIGKMKNGCILCGGVGSGKSRTALAYYLFRVCEGFVRVNMEERDYQKSTYREMEHPRDLYIITTAKKRDSLEWEQEAANFGLSKNPEESHSGVKVTVDSWNNIKKYKDVFGAFFIFDEQRVVGSGAWVKAFLNIARKNQWVLLSATPGDQWTDYIPVFVANGFYKNKTEFNACHCVFSRFSKYPRIERYVGEKRLEQHRDDILVPIDMKRRTTRVVYPEIVEYDKDLYRTVFRDRWDPYDDCPIEETGKLMYLLRKVVNSDPSRIETVASILRQRKRAIIFYNFTYELEMLREYLDKVGYEYAEWNGERHQSLPSGERWAYLVQYSAGCEGWNCVTTDTIIFFSQNYSYRITEQACGRIDRRDTPYVYLHYYYLRSKAPIDMGIYRALQNKKNFNERSFIEK